jgi:hypothetical protein
VDPVSHIRRGLPNTVAAQAAQLAEAAAGVSEEEAGDGNGQWFRREIVLILRALYTASHWSGRTTMGLCAQRVDALSNPSLREDAIGWLEHWLTRRPADRPVGDSGPSREEAEQWSSAKAKIDTLFQAGAGSQNAGAMSSLAQVLDTWRDRRWPRSGS